MIGSLRKEGFSESRAYKIVEGKQSVDAKTLRRIDKTLNPYLRYGNKDFSKRFNAFSKLQIAAAEIQRTTSRKVSDASRADDSLKQLQLEKVKQLKSRIGVNYRRGVNKIKYILADVEDQRTRAAAGRVLSQGMEKSKQIYDKSKEVGRLKEVEQRLNSLLSRIDKIYQGSIQIGDIKRLDTLNTEIEESLHNLQDQVKQEIRKKEYIHEQIRDEVKKERIQELEEAGVVESMDTTKNKVISIVSVKRGKQSNPPISRREKALKRMEISEQARQNMGQSSSDMAKQRMKRKMEGLGKGRGERGINKFIRKSDSINQQEAGHEGWNLPKANNSGDFNKKLRSDQAKSSNNNWYKRAPSDKNSGDSGWNNKSGNQGQGNWTKADNSGIQSDQGWKR